VNKTELVNAVSGKTDMRRSEASKAVDAVFDAIAAALKGGDTVRLVGLGSFSVGSRVGSKGRVGRAGEKLKISGSLSVASGLRQALLGAPQAATGSRREPAIITAVNPLVVRDKSENNSTDDLNAALEAARSRGRERVAAILSGEGMLSAEEFGKLIGVSRVTVNQKRQRREVLALEGARRGFRFPEWQIGEDGKPFSELPDLFDRLGGSPWAVYRFLVQHHPELDGLTGVEALRRGQTTQVIDAAESTLRAAS
jgi:nucleoid DNA-binding protein